MLKTKFSEKIDLYNGQQLKSLYNYLEHHLLGSSVVAWVGPCDIPAEHIVDGEDLKAGSKIFSENMLHFIFEIFEASLTEMVLLQRLFGEIIKTEIFKLSEGRIYLERKGDDLYLRTSKQVKGFDLDLEKDKDLKLNISIATVSPVSGLMHFGINISSNNTPVKTVSLVDLGISPHNFAILALSRVSEEWLKIKDATQKVKWVN